MPIDKDAANIFTPLMNNFPTQQNGNFATPQQKRMMKSGGSTKRSV